MSAVPGSISNPAQAIAPFACRINFQRHPTGPRTSKASKATAEASDPRALAMPAPAALDLAIYKQPSRRHGKSCLLILHHPFYAASPGNKFAVNKQYPFCHGDLIPY